MKLVGNLKQSIVEEFNFKNSNVYIGEQNINHIKTKHLEDYKNFFKFITLIITEPDYYGKNPKDNSLELIKILKLDETTSVKVAVRVTSSGILYARTLYKLNLQKFNYKVKKGYYKNIKG